METQTAVRALSRYVLIGLFGVFLAGCVVVTPDIERRSAPAQDPVFEAVSLSGLLFQGELQEKLRTAVHDCSLARSVTSDAPVRLEGRLIEAKHDTDSKRIIWNVINSGTLLFLFGGPYLGSTVAYFEIRLYYKDELVKTYQGKGRAYWCTVGHPFHNIPQGRIRALQRAGYLAVLDAVEAIVKSPPNRTM